jgi:hypothetical protein
MSRDFPELTTIGALFRFAQVLEEIAIEVLEAAAGKAGDQGEALQKLATKHRRRADELELARREKLNETVLEPLMDQQTWPRPTPTRSGQQPWMSRPRRSSSTATP